LHRPIEHQQVAEIQARRLDPDPHLSAAGLWLLAIRVHGPLCVNKL